MYGWLGKYAPIKLNLPFCKEKPLFGAFGALLTVYQTVPDFIRDKTLDACEELVSFDVVSLFTKIPVDLAVKVAEERLREDASLGQRTSLPVEDIIHLLSFCLKTTQFTYNGTYYQQFLVQRWVRPSLLSLPTW